MNSNLDTLEPAGESSISVIDPAYDRGSRIGYIPLWVPATPGSMPWPATVWCTSSRRETPL